MRPTGLLLLSACGLTVTNEVPSYEDLSPEDQAIVQRILANATVFHQEVLARGKPGIDAVLDENAIQVHFRELIVATNLGDGYLRMSTWAHLRSSQRELIAKWWLLDLNETAAKYPRVFYDYLATHLAALQWIYDMQGAGRVLDRRPRFNVERDAQRLTAAMYRETDSTPMVEVADICQAVRFQYDEQFYSHYDEEYFREHIMEIANPERPTEYFWFFCRWLDDSIGRPYSLANEMTFIRQRCQMWDTGCAIQ